MLSTYNFFNSIPANQHVVPLGNFTSEIKSESAIWHVCFTVMYYKLSTPDAHQGDVDGVKRLEVIIYVHSIWYLIKTETAMHSALIVLLS